MADTTTTNPNNVNDLHEHAPALRGQSARLADHEGERNEDRAGGRDGTQRSRVIHQHVQDGRDQRDGGRQDRTDREPLQSIAVLPRRTGIAEPRRDQGDEAATDQLTPPSSSEKGCLSMTKDRPVARAAT